MREPGTRTPVGWALTLVLACAAAWFLGAALRPAFPGEPGRATAGYALLPRTTALTPGRPGEYAFTVSGPDGRPAALAAPPRLLVVRRDATGLRRPRPVAGPDGVWRAPLTLPAGGPYRVLAEVTPVGGATVTLGADLAAPGPFDPAPFPPSRTAEVDGYQVRLDGDLVPGVPAQVFATVSLRGAPVTDLEPVDDAFGRLVALRAGDLAAADVHPDAAPPAPTDRAGPGIAFTAEVPAAGPYRLFLDFRHGGAVRTAVFTVVTPAAG
jgi:hypothetical protein